MIRTPKKVILQDKQAEKTLNELVADIYTHLTSTSEEITIIKKSNLPELTSRVTSLEAPTVIPSALSMPTITATTAADETTLYQYDAYILFSWNNVGAEVSYNLRYKKTTGTDWTIISIEEDTSLETRTYQQGKLDCGVEFQYQIQSVKGSEFSEWTIVAAITTWADTVVPADPANLSKKTFGLMMLFRWNTITYVSDTSMKEFILWIYTADTVGSAIIFKKLSWPSGSTTVRIGDKSEDESLTLAAGTKYWWWLQAKDKAGNVSAKVAFGGQPLNPEIKGFKNLKIVYTSGTQLTITADSAELRNGTGINAEIVTFTNNGSGISHVCDISTAGPVAGGRDQSGVLPVGTWCFGYIIGKLADGTTQVIASSSSTSPTLPSGYDYWIRCTAFYVYSTDIRKYNQFGNKLTYDELYIKENAHPSVVDTWEELYLRYGYTSILGGNQILNGAFETDPNVQWTPINGTIASVAGGQAGNCCELTCVDQTAQHIQQDISGLTVGSAYQVTAYIKSGTSGDEACLLAVTELDGTLLFSSGGTSSGAWVQYSCFGVATETTLRVVLEKSTATPGTMLFDTVYFYKKNVEAVPNTALEVFGRFGITDATLARLGMGVASDSAGILSVRKTFPIVLAAMLALYKYEHDTPFQLVVDWVGGFPQLYWMASTVAYDSLGVLINGFIDNIG